MTRSPEAPVDDRFLQRWSPRSLSGKALSAQTLMSLMEAARWAPSTTNSQPWRFVYALAGSPGFGAMFETLVPFNQGWAHKASALIAVLSATRLAAPGSEEAKPAPFHAFDTGAAWMSLALQAQAMGLCAHAMGGFNVQALRSGLAIPDEFAVHCIVAVGEQAPRESLAAALQEREAPTGRQPLAAMVCEGRFGFQR